MAGLASSGPELGLSERLSEPENVMSFVTCIGASGKAGRPRVPRLREVWLGRAERIVGRAFRLGAWEEGGASSSLS